MWKISSLRILRLKLMSDFLQRTRLLFGDDSVEKLKKSCVAVFGIGGVGGHAAEAVVRSGVGKLIVADRDAVDFTNINRQAVADISTVGKYKTDVMEIKAKLINPDIEVVKFNHSFSDDYDIVFANRKVDAVIDCIDDVTAKINLICYCKHNGIPIVSSMGTALRKHPESVGITDIYKTSYDPLARVLRKELRKRGIKNLTVVCSEEEPMPRNNDALASCAFVPAAAGLCAAGKAIRFICGEDQI